MSRAGLWIYIASYPFRILRDDGVGASFFPPARTYLAYLAYCSYRDRSIARNNSSYRGVWLRIKDFLFPRELRRCNTTWRRYEKQKLLKASFIIHKYYEMSILYSRINVFASSVAEKIHFEFTRHRVVDSDDACESQERDRDREI